MKVLVMLLLLQSVVFAESMLAIGNSLTNQPYPPWLTQGANGLNQVDVHIHCGASIPFIYNNPNTSCNNTGPWTDHMAANEYAYLSVQPHYGSTIDQDVSIIEEWMTTESNATLILHQGWSYAATLDEWIQPWDGETMQHHPLYYRMLLSDLRQRLPGRDILVLPSMELIWDIAHDPDSPFGPNAQDLYADSIHLETPGRYLVHNYYRQLLGQPRWWHPSQPFDDDLRLYMDDVLDRTTVPEPSSLILLVVVVIGASKLTGKRIEGSG